jgi:hypothetical protein
MSMKILLVREGERLDIRAIAYPSDNGGKRDKCPTLQFFQENGKEHPDELDALSALLTETASNGPPADDRKFKNLPGTGGLYEFKTRGGLRLFCFWDEGSLIICTHGYEKARQKANSIAPNE